jgi:hypothetical protein
LDQTRNIREQKAREEKKQNLLRSFPPKNNKRHLR